jgi:acyl-CoA thioester hydrolase
VTRPPFKFSARTRVGFSDTDAQGIVYYGRYNPYFDLARVEYHRMLGLLHVDRGDGDFVMRANDVEYFAPARFDDELEIFVRVSRIGRTSITFEFGAYKVPGDTLMVTAHQTLVYIDHEKREAREVPGGYRDAVTAYEGDNVEQ